MTESINKFSNLINVLNEIDTTSTQKLETHKLLYNIKGKPNSYISRFILWVKSTLNIRNYNENEIAKAIENIVQNGLNSLTPEQFSKKRLTIFSKKISYLQEHFKKNSQYRHNLFPLISKIQEAAEKAFDFSKELEKHKAEMKKLKKSMNEIKGSLREFEERWHAKLDVNTDILINDNN